MIHAYSGIHEGRRITPHTHTFIQMKTTKEDRLVYRN